MLCSFQRPEPWQPVHQWTMPIVPSPEQCEDEEVVYARAIQNSKSNPKVMHILQERLTVSNLHVPFHAGFIHNVDVHHTRNVPRVPLLSSVQRNITLTRTALSDTCIGWKPEIYPNTKLISRRWAWNLHRFPPTFVIQIFYLFTVHSCLYIWLAFVCLVFINSLGCLHEQ